jgi:hypothetical protein
MILRRSDHCHRFCFPQKALLFASAASVFFAKPAFAETKASVDVSANASFDSNPFLFTGRDTETATFRLEATPVISHNVGASNFNLTGKAEITEYSQRYDAAVNLRADGVASHKVDSRLTVRASVGVSSAVSNSDIANRNIPRPAAPDNQPAPVFDPANPGDDFSAIGIRQRQNSYRMGAGASYILSARDQITWSTNALLLRNDRQQGLSEYNFVSHNLGYNRQIDSRLSLGAVFIMSISDFRYVRFGDATTFSPQFSVKTKLNGRFDLSAFAGATITRVKLAVGERTSHGLSGSLNLCYREERNNACLSAQRQTAPASLGGVRVQNSISGSYSRRLSAADSISANASYSRANEPILGGQRAISFVTLQGRYERRFNARLFGHISGGYSDNYENGVPRRASIRGLLGVTYRFGVS